MSGCASAAGLPAISPDRPSLGWLAGLIAPSGLAGLDLDGDGAAADRPADRPRLRDRRGCLRPRRRRPTPPTCPTSSACSPPSSPIRAGTRPCSRASAAPRSRASISSLLGLGAGRARAGRRDPPQRPALAADREGRDAGGDGRAVPRLLHALARRRARSTRSSSATSSSRRRSRRCGGRSARCRAGRGRRRPPPRGAAARPRPTPAPRTLHPSGRSQPGLCPDRLVDARRRDHIRERRALALAANMFETRLFDRLREQEGATYAPDAIAPRRRRLSRTGASSTPPPRSGRPRAATFFRIAREIVADLAARPAEAGRVRARAQSGAERHRAAARDQRLLGRRARELGRSDPRDIENVRTYLADYRALTAGGRAPRGRGLCDRPGRLVDAGASG